MKVSEIIEGLNIKLLAGSLEEEFTGICSDSRKVSPGDLFLALKGCAVDGESFVEQALASGAVAAVGVQRWELAQIADRFYKHPSGRLKLIGITGTNGKTTTVTLLYRLFMRMGIKCGLLSTIANYVGTERLETANTTADPITINSLLSQMVDNGCQFCFMEVSSIGVEQQRIGGLEFSMGIFSNLTHDHLDYHGSFAEYLKCKKLFFDMLPKNAVALTNIDDKNGLVMVQNTKAKVISYSVKGLADHSCRIIEQSMDGTLLQIDGTEVWVSLVGEHNVYNLLAIYSAAVEMGFDKEEVLLGISVLKEAPGRFECIRIMDSKTIVIDYAHTPDALENVLKTLKKVCPKQEIVCVFGCGGNRDKSKRPEMAAVSEKYADRIIVTSDNSRDESTQEIMEQIRQGFSSKGRIKSLCIEDRKEAIKAAILFSKPGASILLAGKGHETYQIIGKEKLHFDEREIIQEVLKSC